MHKLFTKIFIVFIGLTFVVQNVYAQETFLSSLGEVKSFYRSFKEKKVSLADQKQATSKEETKIIEAFIQQGDKFYQRGSISEAISDFSRALLLDPHNQMVQRTLIQLSSHPQLDGKQKINLYLLEDLFYNVNKLKIKIDSLEKKQEYVWTNIIEKGYDQGLLQHEMEEIQNKILVNLNRPKHISEKEYPQQKDPLEIVNASLDYEKNKLINKMIYLQKQYNYLINMQEGGWSNRVRSQRVYSKSDKPLNIYAQNFYRDDLKKDYQRDVGLVAKREAERMTQKLEVLKGEVRQKKERVKSVTQQLVDATLKLSESKSLLDEKNKDIKRLNRDLQDAQSRSEFTQRIIQEKESKIQSLEKVQEQVLVQTQEMGALKKELEGLQNKVVKLEREKINIQKAGGSIQEEYKKSQKERDSFQDDLLVQKKSFKDIQKKLAKVQGEAIDLKQLVKDKENQVALLKKNLKKDETKGSLHTKFKKEKEVFRKELKKKDAQLKVLNQQLVSSKEKIDQVHKIVKEKTEKITKAIIAKDKKIKLLQKGLSEKEKNLNELAKELEASRKDLKNIKKSAVSKEPDQAQNQKLNELDEIVKMYRLALQDANKTIAVKGKQVEKLNKQLVMAYPESSTQNEVIKEKEERIQLLKKALIKNRKEKDQYNENLRKVVLAKVKELNALEEEFDIYREAVHEAHEKIVRKDEELKTLNKEVEALQWKLIQTFDSQNDKIAATNDSFSTKNEKVYEMEGVLSIYKEELKDAKWDIKTKEASIVTLEEQLMLTQTRLFKKGKMLKETQSNIALLERKLESIQKKVVDSKKSFFR
ncbi:hypothetical protein MNBD_UNCLBAC01-714 [hydrothermal vent metagenome]|uniref:Uncharacterized protein n=1 Tax=hydrothermal vent metagenome TaxID=652676 RepID=A0A3B1DDP6_9ZZZZ